MSDVLFGIHRGGFQRFDSLKGLTDLTELRPKPLVIPPLGGENPTTQIAIICVG